MPEPAAPASPETPQRPLAACSPRLLRLLLVLALDRTAATAAWVQLCGAARPEGVRDAALLADLVRLARASAPAAQHLEALLAAQVQAEAPRFREQPLAELAARWARERARLRGKGLAALLWSVARRPEPFFRKLEERLVEEVEVLALQTLADPHFRGAGPAAPDVV
ncbi:MAG: hypothetical protein KatS3mg131_0738 [Candidatus Tectimicrobiota bacterium]|nr:MAG: hypothetical protein KatS3mg131_0738 [Candidatus Tectomicrobia bacterium]